MLDDIVSKSTRPAIFAAHPGRQPSPLIDQIHAMADAANEGVTAERQILRSTLREVARREFNASPIQNAEARKFATLRAVDRFLQGALTASAFTSTYPHRDLLPVGHPMSENAAIRSLTASGLREMQARWHSSDPELDENLRPLVASAFRVDPQSLEFRHAMLRIEAVGHKRLPPAIMTDLLSRSV